MDTLWVHSTSGIEKVFISERPNFDRAQTKFVLEQFVYLPIYIQGTLAMRKAEDVAERLPVGSGVLRAAVDLDLRGKKTLDSFVWVYSITANSWKKLTWIWRFGLSFLSG